MSHFSTLSVQLKKQSLVNRICKEMSLTTEHMDVYENPWRYAHESVKDCTVFKNVDGKVIFLTNKKGDVIHDTWSMGTEAFTFLKKYSEMFIRQTASAEGATVVSKGVDNEGNQILEIQYAF